MHASEPLTALVVGSVSRDLESGRERPGGVVHYAGLALTQLGIVTRVVTRVAREDDTELLAPLRAAGAAVCALPSRATTVCRNDYAAAVDRHELCAVSDPIAVSDLPPDWLDSHVVQLGPLHRDDLHPGMGAQLSGWVGLDLQGLARERSAAGTRLAALDALPLYTRGVGVIKASEEELSALAGPRGADRFRRDLGADELIVTRGASGATLVTQDGRLDLPAHPARRRFPTGAGDVFLAAYLLGRARGAKPPDAAQLALRVSAEQVERGEVGDAASHARSAGRETS